jgi:hypothetical protein
MSMSEGAQPEPASFGEGTGGGGGGGGGEGDRQGWLNVPLLMSETTERTLVPQPALKCPRCDSTNTKFCYFNNYSLTQPRHFCHACRRYWTRGGALRRAKRRTKPKAAIEAAGGMSLARSMAPNSATAAMPAGMHEYSAPCSSPTSSEISLE